MADDDKKDWLNSFGEIMGGGSEIVRNVAEAYRALTGRNDPSPVSVPSVAQAQAERKAVQGETRTPASGQFADVPWVPILAVVAIVVMMKA